MLSGLLRRRQLSTVAASMVTVLTLSACGTSGDSSSAVTTTTTTSAAPNVALLLPENETARYETQDRPLFTAKLKELCPSCTLTYANAQGNAEMQLTQGEQAINNGADVIVLDPVDAAAAASIVARAKVDKIPVISYDRLVKNADVDFHVSFDNEQIGRLQATTLLDTMTANGTAATGSVVMFNGSPTDANAAAFKRGAHSVLDDKVRIAKEYDTDKWSAERAKVAMTQSLNALGRTSIAGVYAANDNIAGSVVAAMQEAGLTPLPPVTGQDADLPAIQRIVAGTQLSTIYKPFRPEAEQAATLASAFIQKSALPVTTITMDNGQKQVPTFLLPVQSVTRANIRDTVIRDGYWTAAQICTGLYASGCSVLGIA